MPADEHRSAPALGERLRGEQRRIGSAAAGSIDERFAHRLFGRTPRNQIDHASEGARTVQRRRHPFDDFDLAEVGWRNLQQAKAADVGPEQRKPV